MDPKQIESRLFTTREVAREVNLKPHQLEYKLRNGKLPDAKLKLAGRRLFTQDEVEIIRVFVNYSRGCNYCSQAQQQEVR